MRYSRIHTLLLCCLMLTAAGTAAFAQKADAIYTITRIQPPLALKKVSGTDSIQIRVGDTFRGSDNIVWSSDDQVVYAKEIGSGKLCVFSKAASDSRKAKTPNDFFVRAKGSSRGMPGIQRGHKDAEHFPMSRLALVVGNSNYKWESTLANPIQDASKVTKKLMSLGFDVITLFDATFSEFRDHLDFFNKQAGRYDVALLYYAGHGFQNLEGKVFLVPVDNETSSTVDREHLISVSSLIADVAKTSKIRLFFMDACRNLHEGRASGVAMNQIEAPLGVGYMFSTSSGRLANDGEGENSPFAQAFLSSVGTPDQSLEDTMRDIKRHVLEATDNQQIPISNSGLAEKFVFQEGIVSPMGSLIVQWESDGDGTEAQGSANTSSQKSFVFALEDDVAELSIDRDSVRFLDADGDEAISAGEECSICFTVRNSGEGNGQDNKVNASVEGTPARHIQIGTPQIENIPAGKSVPVVIPVSATNALKDGTVVFTVYISDAAGFSSESFRMTVCTRKNS